MAERKRLADRLVNRWAIRGLAALLAVLAGVLALLILTPPEPRPTAHEQGTSVRATGEALIGGSFELVAHDGRRLRDSDFAGRHMLIYFGFTYCPDVCPLDLARISDALEQLDAKRLDRVQPLFITVDPARDTPETMARYLAHFHPAILGLTGTADEIRQAAQAYRVYYTKVEDEGSAAGYTMDHSAIIYLMGPDGRFVTHFSADASADDIARELLRNL
jgi:cytochrome oxidase Cu insertion factor (SCO1/SenC/PrrC family)